LRYFLSYLFKKYKKPVTQAKINFNYQHYYLDSLADKTLKFAHEQNQTNNK